MPSLGTANNPGGVNGLYDDGEEPYGAIKRLKQQTQSAPLAGETEAGSALASSRRAQRQAARPTTTPVQTATATEPPQTPASTTPLEPVPAELVDQHNAQTTWAQLAQHPDASPLVHQLAAEALR